MKTLELAFYILCMPLFAGCMGKSTRSASLSIGDALMREVYEVSGSTARRKVVGPDRKVYEESVRKIEETELVDFWYTLQAAGVDQWQTQYQAQKIDGRTHVSDWSLSVTFEEKIAESHGNGAYPSSDDPGVTTSNISDRFRRVYDAFQRLIKSDNP